jgi:threonine aldolase
MLAAGAQHGLDHHLARLAEDHGHAKRLGAMVDGVGGARIVPPDTNILMIDLPAPRAGDIVAAAKARGLLVTQWSPTRIRAVTHLDADLAAVEMAGRLLAELLAT